VKPMADFTELLDSWQEGVEHFNARRFWEAHECWERGWASLPHIQKLHVQALIQTAGVFDLVKRGRPGAARSLSRLALEKIELRGAVPDFPRIHISGLQAALTGISVMTESELPLKIAEIRLQAELLLSPES
jgi:hypothetical protein